jgi:hypothetical protein
VGKGSLLKKEKKRKRHEKGKGEMEFDESLILQLFHEVLHK